jgi:uncharacterized membrane protein
MKRKLIEKNIERKTTLSERISDAVTGFVGSWSFIICQTVVFVTWIGYNTIVLKDPFDPFPFIFLTLVLSLEAVYTTPLIMMSQNRQENRDRIRDDADFEADIKAEKNVEILRSEIEDLKRKIEKYIDSQEKGSK